MFSPDFLSTLAKFANVLIVAAFEMVWHEALADVLEKGKVNITDGNGELILVVMVMLGLLVMMAVMFLAILVMMGIVMSMMVMMTMMVILQQILLFRRNIQMMSWRSGKSFTRWSTLYLRR